MSAYTARAVNTVAEAIDDGPDPRTQVTELARYVIDYLRGNGFAVVELPKPDEVDDSEPGEVITSWAGHEPEFGVAFNSSYGVTADLPEWFDGTERLYAAALLAAADAAERGES